MTIDIDAPPEQVWALITDVTQMGRRSPECRSCKWLGDATGDARLFEKLLQSTNQGTHNVAVTVGWTEGLSTEPSSARGRVDLDLLEGRITGERPTLPPGDTHAWVRDALGPRNFLRADID